MTKVLAVVLWLIAVVGLFSTIGMVRDRLRGWAKYDPMTHSPIPSLLLTALSSLVASGFGASNRAHQTNMLSPGEIVSACVGELYRYRLAVQDQLPRIAAATQAVRAVRDQIEKDEDVLLFAPSMSKEAFRDELEAIHHRDIPDLLRLKSEAQFLLVAVYGILTMSKAIRAASVGEVKSCVQQAISAFEKAAPDADLLRHLHEHIDAYMRGKGRDTHRLPDPTSAGGVGMLDKGLVYFIGGKLFDLSEIATAADELAQAVAACTR